MIRSGTTNIAMYFQPPQEGQQTVKEALSGLSLLFFFSPCQTPARCGRQHSQLYLWAIMWGVELHFLHRTLPLADCIQASAMHRESLSSRSTALCDLSEEDVVGRSQWVNPFQPYNFIRFAIFLQWRELCKLSTSFISLPPPLFWNHELPSPLSIV